MQVQNVVDELVNTISILENQNNKRTQVYEWIEGEMDSLRKIREKPTRINVETIAQEISNLNELMQNVNEKQIEISELVSDGPSDKLLNNLNVLTDEVNQTRKLM